MKHTIFITFFILTCAFSHAQIQWQHCYGGSQNEGAVCIRTTFDGGYILAGGTKSNDGDVSGNHGGFDVWVLKISASGSIEWQQCYGGTGDDATYDIRQTTDSGYIVIGHTTSYDGQVKGNHGGEDVWVLKIAANGTLQWQKCLGGSADEYGTAIWQTKDAGFILAAYTNSTDGDVIGNHGFYDVWVVKLDDTGHIEWKKTYGGSNDEYSATIQQTLDGGYVVGSQSSSNDGDVTGHHGTTSSDFWVIKISDTGSIEWEKSLGGSGFETGGFALQALDSGYLITGQTDSYDGDVIGLQGFLTAETDNENGWIVKLSPQGNIEWNKCIYINGDEYIFAQLQQKDSDYMIVGQTCLTIPISGSSECSSLLGKLSQTGDIDWADAYGGSQNTAFHSISPTDDGVYIATGYSEADDGDVSGNHGGSDVWVAKFGWHEGIGNISKSTSLNIAPNPAGQYLNITSNNIESNVVITNMIGQEVFHGYYPEANFTIDVSDLHPGLYYLKVNNTEFSKFIKE